MKIEFEKMLGEKVCDTDYEEIELVYTYHPCNFDKKAIVNLYKEFGMNMIKDLVPRSKVMRELEGRVKKAKGEIYSAEKLMDYITNSASIEDIQKFM